MNSRLRAVLGLGMLILASSLGCSSAHTDAAVAGASGANVAGASNSVAGDANVGGANSGTANGGTSSGGSTATVSGCLEHPPALRTRGATLSLAITPTLSGKPFEFGQPNAFADGGSLVPTNFRFYVSEVQLLPNGGAPVAVDLVTLTGEPEPYGVHLFNAEEDDTATLRVLAPAGDYKGLSFALGIKLACNQQAPATMGEPLTDVSQMTWPHAGGYLFLRYESLYTDKDGKMAMRPGVPAVVHMGGNITKEFVPRVTVSSAFSLSASGTLEKRLGVAMEQIFAGSTADIDVSDVAVGFLSTPESIAGERLRRELPDLSVFALDPALSP
jgi:hypothetical protein